MYTIYVHSIVLKMLLAVVELQRLPLLLLLNLHVHKSCAGSVAAVVRHRAQDDAMCCCVFFAAESSVSFLFFKRD